jgi:DNA-binding protein YbaB
VIHCSDEEVPMPPTDALDDAYERLRRIEQEAVKAREVLASVRGTAHSRDRMVDVEVGPTGEIETLDFRSTAYRDMAPKELATLVVGTVQTAWADAQAQVREHTRVLREEQVRLLGSLDRD